MDQNGRIGGEPVGPEGMEMIEPEDDLPFDISELQIVDEETGMYEGGLAGYAPGGEVTATPVPQNPFSPTGSTAGFEIREYVNDAGEVLYIQFMNGQPMTFIPQGYKPKDSVAQQAATGAGVAAQAAPTTSTSSNDDNDYGVKAPSDEGKKATDWNKATNEDFAKAIKGLGSAGTVGTIAGAFLPGPLGVAVGIGAQSQARYKAYDMLSGIDYQLESMSEDDPRRAILEGHKEQLQKIVSTDDDGESDDGIIGKSGIFGGRSGLYEGLQDISGDGRVTFQDTWLGDLFAGDGKLGVQGPDLAASRRGARRGERATVSDKNITVTEKGTGASVTVTPEARNRSDSSGASSSGSSSNAAINYGKAATGSTKIKDSDGGTRIVTTYDPDKVKKTKYNPGGR